MRTVSTTSRGSLRACRLHSGLVPACWEPPSQSHKGKRLQALCRFSCPFFMPVFWRPNPQSLWLLSPLHLPSSFTSVSYLHTQLLGEATTLLQLSALNLPGSCSSVARVPVPEDSSRVVAPGLDPYSGHISDGHVLHRWKSNLCPYPRRPGDLVFPYLSNHGFCCF